MKKGVETRSAFNDAVIAFGRVPDDPAAVAETAAGGGEPAATGLSAREVAAEVAAPNAKDLLGRCTLFPLYPTLTKRDVQLIAKVLAGCPDPPCRHPRLYTRGGGRYSGAKSPHGKANSQSAHLR